MREMENRKVSSILGIAIVCLFAVIYLAISYYVIDGEVSKYGYGYERFYVVSYE